MNIRSIFGWAIFLVIVGMIIHQLPSIPGRIYFIKGHRHYSSRQYQAAAQAFEQAVKADPQLVRAYVELGSSYRELKKPVEAEQAFKKALSIRDDSCAACGLGMVYHDTNRYEEAEKAFKKAISFDPNDYCAYEHSGRLYYDQHSYNETIEAFIQAIRLRPLDTSYHYLGNAYGYSGRFDEAVDAYQHSLKINSNYVEVYPDLGAAYYRLHRYQDAVAAFEQAIKSRQDDAKAYFGMGLAQLALGNKVKALEQYRSLQSLEPQWASWLLREINKGSSQPVFRNALRPGVLRQARGPQPRSPMGVVVAQRRLGYGFSNFQSLL